MRATLGPDRLLRAALTEPHRPAAAAVRPRNRPPVPLTFAYRDTPIPIRSRPHREGPHPTTSSGSRRAPPPISADLMSIDLLHHGRERPSPRRFHGASFECRPAMMCPASLPGIGVHTRPPPALPLRVVEARAGRSPQDHRGTDPSASLEHPRSGPVLFTKLCKYVRREDGGPQRPRFPSRSWPRGRKGFANHGYVEPRRRALIENLRLEAKAGDDPAKKRRIVRKSRPRAATSTGPDTFGAAPIRCPSRSSRASAGRTACCSTCSCGRAAAARHEAPGPRVARALVERRTGIRRCDVPIAGRANRELRSYDEAASA